MQAIHSLFPKLFQGESLEGLADSLHETGIGSVDLLIRDGYWVTPSGLGKEAPDYVQYMQQRRIEVPFATTSYTPEMLLKDPGPLEVMADLGIRSFRMGYLQYDASVPLDSQLTDARVRMEKLAELCSKHRMKAIYQVHHGRSQLIQHSMSALTIVRDLPPEHVGIMLDPGNQYHDGRENSGKAVALLGRYLAAIGVKDVAVMQDASKRHLPNKGWSTVWAPCQEGLIDWHEISESMQVLDSPVIVNLQMHYHLPDRRVLLDTLREEWAYVVNAFGKRDGRSA
ncbi:sugar phosphate isomerase/epimerase family protein [Paenibacillus hemerocallicola]|nr:TIM barrel protein [Paenibacillus hemerocallicola]